MCGIAGFLGDAPPRNFLENANLLQSSRGPDGRGMKQSAFGGLAHTRLALFDLSESGGQPQSNGSLSISYNGEIYNWKEIRAELVSKGTVFYSDSDTEVLLKSIGINGLESTLKKIRGIFAFALYDDANHEVTLVRDRFGTKPIYFSFMNGTLFFASTIKALQIKLEIDPDSLHEYLTLQNTIPPRTLFKNVSILPPGQILKFKRGDAKPRMTEWANLKVTKPIQISMNEAVEEMDRLLNQSVKRNLKADVPVGTFLSGGIDSGLINIAAAKFQSNTNSFTIGFDEDREITNYADESELAKKIAGELGIKNYAYKLSENDMWESMPSIALALEEPKVGQSYPNYFASKIAVTKNKAVLAGIGGDEFFGGYTWRYAAALDDNLSDKKSQIIEMVKLWHRLIPSENLARITGLNSKNHEVNIFHKIEAILEEQNSEMSRYSVRDLMYFDMRMFLPGLLHVEDKISMSMGLEVRVPFLDQDIVDFSLTLPENLLIDSVDMNVTKGKIVLRELMSKYQKGKASGKKQGFTGPDEVWFKDQSRVRKFINKDSNLWSFLDREQTLLELDRHYQGLSNRRLLIWSLIQLEITLESI
jgi:asparagine synthase (glutamine-hydrolysing)